MAERTLARLTAAAVAALAIVAVASTAIALGVLGRYLGSARAATHDAAAMAHAPLEKAYFDDTCRAACGGANNGSRFLGPGYDVCSQGMPEGESCNALACETFCPGRSCFNEHIPDYSAHIGCCCAFAAGAAGPPPDDPVYVPITPPLGEVTSLTCAQFCNAGGFGGGYIIGTAPDCGGDCATDCGDGMCSRAKPTYFTDYGHLCDSDSGDKVCCCASKVPRTRQRLVASGVGSCLDFCHSAGYTRAEIDGTAPACGGDCGDAAACFTATDALSDYGDGCSSGVKKCRCY